jgi:hypothetical protein
MKINKTAAVSGLRLRLDVPTKCKIVEKVLTSTFNSKEDQNSFIELVATQNFVNPLTIKIWCGKYQNTYKIGKSLPIGTMSFAFATVPDNKILSASNQLEDLRKELAKIAKKSQSRYFANLKESDVETTKTPKEILEDLIL